MFVAGWRLYKQIAHLIYGSENQAFYILILKQGTNVAHNVRGGLLIDLTIVAIVLLLRYTLSMSLKLTDITQWNVGAVVLEQF